MARDGDAQVELFVNRGLIEYFTPRDLTIERPPARDTLTTDKPTFKVVVPGAPIEVDMVVAPVPDEPAVTLFAEANIEDIAKDRVRALWSPEGGCSQGSGSSQL